MIVPTSSTVSVLVPRGRAVRGSYVVATPVGLAVSLLVQRNIFQVGHPDFDNKKQLYKCT